MLVGGVLENLKTIQPIVIALSCLEEIDYKTLVVEIPYTFIIRHGEIKSVLARKHPPC